MSRDSLEKKGMEVHKKFGVQKATPSKITKLDLF